VTYKDVGQAAASVKPIGLFDDLSAGCHLAAATFIFLPLKHVIEFFLCMDVEDMRDNRLVLQGCRGQRMVTGSEGTSSFLKLC